GDQLAEEAIEWTLEFAYVSLKRQDCQPHFFKIQNLDNGKGGAAGWFAAHLQKFLLVRHLLEVPKKMELSDLQDAMSLLSTPLAWNSNYPKVSDDENTEAEEQKPTHSDAVSKAIAKLTEEHKSFFLFAKCLMEGDFNKNLNEMCGTKGFRIVSALFNQDNSSAHKNMEIVIELNKALKGLTETRPVSTTTSSEAPGLGARALAVLQNEEQDHVQRERAEAELNSSHRVFVISMDLYDETSPTPWSSISSLEKNHQEEITKILKFLEKVAVQQTDFIVAFCGRSAINRRFLEDALSVLQCPSTVTDIWLSYRTGKAADRPASRRVFGGAPHHEIGFMKGQVARVRLNTKDRE
ncbi:unnamed protein product, partial [Symbiodinium pilosum]